ncbi:helix-turn-helix transcriptional regulator [Marivirga harenae]|uniref:response regulator transcription factor n=1 Tax=Marivirga harenae TaxID=2010992 RepID=UPI0026DEFB16|nr:helix-turn-helix transcriptional regulator [Marivirga harenae]WKV11532.1 helix-turn-helix transcriptional regulator [Marivirga harenae]|tara:strand:- start:17173 stop:17481 length:309 start_codon:yes stop_codon:yes gene_type:complete
MSSYEPKPTKILLDKSYSLHKLNRIVKQEDFKVQNLKKFNSLTTRELEIFELVVNNHNNPQIADKLCISRNTVEQHRKNINRKLETHNITEIYNYALAFDVV